MPQWKASRSLEAARPQHPVQHQAQHSSPDRVHRGESRRRGVSEPAGRAYTIAHAGRQVRFGPVAFWIAVGTVVIMAGWSVTAATYLAFRDDVLRTLIARQAQQQFGYEDRIAELRAQIDRTTSRQLLDQEQFEQKLDELIRRQAALESRATALSSLTDPATTGSIGGAAKLQDKDSLAEPSRSDRGRQSSIGATLGRMDASLDRIEQRQSLALGDLESRYENKARRIRSVLDQIGVKIDAAPAATGGPFVPVRPPPANEGFARALFEANLARSEVAQLTDTLRTVPVRKPVTGDIEITSPFGIRMDPFVMSRRSTPAWTFAARSANRRTPPRRHESPSPVGTAATATWSRSITATACRPATAICRRSMFSVGDKFGIGQVIGADRLDRALDRPASALRNADQRRSGRSAEIPRPAESCSATANRSSSVRRTKFSCAATISSKRLATPHPPPSPARCRTPSAPAPLA